MKLLMEPIDVEEIRSSMQQHKAPHGQQTNMSLQSTYSNSPRAFCWRGHLYEVESILEQWLARGQWWGIEEHREYYMVLTQRGVMEVYKGREGWMLSRIVD